MAQLLCSWSIKRYTIVKTNVIIIIYVVTILDRSWITWNISSSILQSESLMGNTQELLLPSGYHRKNCWKHLYSMLCYALTSSTLNKLTNFSRSVTFSWRQWLLKWLQTRRVEGCSEIPLWKNCLITSIQIWDRNWIETLWTKIFLTFVTLKFLENIFMTSQ